MLSFFAHIFPQLESFISGLMSIGFKSELTLKNLTSFYVYTKKAVTAPAVPAALLNLTQKALFRFSFLIKHNGY